MEECERGSLAVFQFLQDWICENNYRELPFRCIEEGLSECIIFKPLFQQAWIGIKRKFLKI